MADIEELVGALTLDEKCSLTAGQSLWYLPAVERLGIPSLKVSDGPSGVRGDSLIGRRSLSLPCGMAVGSTWDPELVGRLGGVLAAEARSKNVHVLLGPTVCIVRMPLAGRTFESFSEDPLLTARLAVAYVRGVQAGGVACCIKHFACNDQEHERMTISAEVDERTLHEVHLAAFEAAVREAGVWAVMTAYNKVNGVWCGEQPDLIGRVLRGKWGSDALVMSDWFGTHSTRDAAVAGLELEMPGPSAWLGPSLAAAVRDGVVEEAVVDEKVRHLLGLMERVGILGAPAPSAEAEEDDPGRRSVARQVAAAGTVLLVNDGLLPLDVGAVSSVAVIGPNAAQLAVGGGSSEVTPHRRRSLAAALAERMPGVDVRHEVGCRIDKGLPPIDLRLLAAESFQVEYFDSPEPPGVDAAPVEAELAHTARVMWIGPPRPGLEVGRCAVRVSATFTPDALRGVAAGPRERRAVGAPPRRAGGGRQHRADAGHRVLRRRERAGRGGVARSRRDGPTRCRSRCGRGRTTPPFSGRASWPTGRWWTTSSHAPWRRPRRATWRWWWSGRTASGSPRGTTGWTCRCRAASASWSRPCWRRTRGPWWW